MALTFVRQTHGLGSASLCIRVLAAPVLSKQAQLVHVPPRNVGRQWRSLASSLLSCPPSHQLGISCPSSIRFLSPNLPRNHFSTVTFVEPPSDLDDGFLERPIPLLLVAGECHPAEWWDPLVHFLSRKGCSVGAMTLSPSPGVSDCGGVLGVEEATLRQLQTGIAAAVASCGLTPPVLVAHSMAGLVCQHYLQSHGASGLVLLDSFPPDPVTLSRLLILTALPGLTGGDEGLYQVDSDPLLYEPALRWE
ncbi:unnamed protein product [Choristocarpus tenellus]